MINEFTIKYQEKRLKGFWKKRWHAKRHPGWWMAAMELHMVAGKECRLLLKDMALVAVIEKKLSLDHANRIRDMIQSPDVESKYRDFWTNKWKYERTPEEWVNIITDGVWWNSTNPNGSRTSMKSLGLDVSKAKSLLYDAIDKLILEKKLQKKDETRLKEMIDSPDRENAIVAITIMATLKSKKFKQLKPETNE